MQFELIKLKQIVDDYFTFMCYIDDLLIKLLSDKNLNIKTNQICPTLPPRLYINMYVTKNGLPVY